MINTKNTQGGLLFDVIVVCISLVVVLHSGYTCWKTNKEAIAQTQASVDAEADIATVDINNRLVYLMKTGQDFADALTNGKIPYADVENRAKQVLAYNQTNDVPSKFFNFSVSFIKGAYDKNKPEQLANWIYISDKKTGQIALLKRDYDYSIDDKTMKTSWFVKAVNERKAFWQEPKYGDVSDNFLVAYTIPFFTSPNKEKVAGVIAVGFSTIELKTVMYSQDYRKTGFGIILSEEGNLIYHPSELMPLLDVSHDNNKYFKDSFNFIDKIKNDIKENKNLASYNLPEIHEKAWVLFKNIQAANWHYQIVFLESELGISQKTLQSRIYLIVSSIVFIIFLSIILFFRHYKKTTDLWYFSIITTIAFTIGIACLWRAADIKEIELPDGMRKIKSMQEVEKYKKEQNEFLDAIHKKHRFYIPTGVFIRAAEFQGSNNVRVAGYVWQKYQLDDSFLPNKIPDKFCELSTEKIPKTKSILLAEAFESYENANLNCDKASYTEISDRTVTVGWYFNVELREPMDYSSFPLDKNLIWLRMHPISTDDYVVLTPDFSSYPYIYEKFLLGTDAANFVLPSWQVISTFYSTQISNPNSNFGLNNRYRGQPSEELLFNIEVKRVFLDTIFSTVVPIFLIYLILFVILFSSLDDLLSVLAINAGLLFSVALWHSGLRASLSSAGVTYFETYYFVCYFMISLVCINSVLLACQYELPLLHYKNNLLSKLTFLPLVTGVTFLITLFLLF